MLFTLLHKILQAESVKDDYITGIIKTQNSNVKRAVERQWRFIWFPSINSPFPQFRCQSHLWRDRRRDRHAESFVRRTRVRLSANPLFFNTSEKCPIP